jgi:hypothetical protein
MNIAILGYGKMGMMKKMKPMTDDEFMAMSVEEIAAMEDEEPMKKGSGMKNRGRPVRKDDDLNEETSEDVIDLPNEVFEYISALESANAELLDQVEKLAKSVEVVAEEEPPLIIDEEETEQEPEVTSEDEIKEEDIQKETEEETSFKPAFELSFDPHDSKEEEEIKEETKPASSQITFDDLLGPDYIDPVFVKPEDLVNSEIAQDPNDVIPMGRSYSDDAQVISIKNDFGSNTISLNDRMAKGIIIGLNDRIAFMNHLFANSSEDYNRVLSQLMTFDTFQEAQDFIENMVKPDYNNWEGKDEYAQRFMEIVEKKFS